MRSCKVLTVCLGNICRSPAAQGILASVAQSNGLSLELDSAGTAAFHVGNSPDKRSVTVLKQSSLDISQQTARQVTQDDFYAFDWILAMDKENLSNLRKIQPNDSNAKLVMFGEFHSGAAFGEVEDPYYGGDDGFLVMKEHLTEISNAFVLYLKK